jgi:general secretion pathway protein A
VSHIATPSTQPGAALHGATAYLAELGLARSPFPPTPDADAYFHTAALERDLGEAAHCLLARKGFVLMTGDVGMGKSTFVRRLLDTVERQGVVASLVFNTFLQGPELLAAILRDFSLEPGQDAADNINRLNGFLVRCWQNGTTCVLIIDDAQNLSLESLELLRLLSNLESGQEKLLQIVLAGQPELEEKLGRHEIRQLTSRIVKHIRMAGLDASETARYVEFRLLQAGAAGRIRMTPSAHAALFRDSRGNPRRIHLIMDRCLYGVVATGQAQIDAPLLRQAASEAGFGSAQARRRWRPFAAAALVAATGLATAAGVAYRPAAPIAAPVLPATLAAVGDAASLPGSVANARHGDWNRCLARLALDVDASADGAVQMFALQPHAAVLLRDRRDVCLQQRDRDWLAAARPQLPPAQLAPGARGEGVRVLQSALLATGDLAPAADGTAPVDGLLGPATRAALAAFQSRHRLPADGLADPLTLLLLEPVVETPTAAPAPSPENPHGRG